MPQDVVQRVGQVALVLDGADASALEPAVEVQQAVAGEFDPPHGLTDIDARTAEEGVEVGVHNREADQLRPRTVAQNRTDHVSELGQGAGEYIVVLEACGAVPCSSTLRRERDRAHMPLTKKCAGEGHNFARKCQDATTVGIYSSPGSGTTGVIGGRQGVCLG